MYVHNIELTSSFLHWTTVYIRIRKGMYGLVQAATLAYKHLEKNLAHHRSSFPCPSITGLWKHVSQQKTFCLCVDDLGINYFLKEDTDHLLISLHSNYRISVNWEGKNYCGSTLDWKYAKGYVDISMLGYIEKVR